MFAVAADCILLVLALALGFSTKAQFLAYLPGVFLILAASFLSAQRKAVPLGKLVLFLCCSFGGMYLIKALAARGVYTSGYSFSRVFENLASRQALLLIAVGVGSALFEAYHLRRDRRPVSEYLKALVPGSVVLSFVAILSPWAIGDSYIIAMTGPLCAACILSAMQRFPRERVVPLLAAVTVFALLLTTYRGYRGFGRLGDFRMALFGEPMKLLAVEPLTVVVPCMEGSDLVRMYLKRMTDYDVEVVRAIPAVPKRKVVAIVDAAICSFSDGAEMEKLRLVSTPRFTGSFGLYELSR